MLSLAYNFLLTITLNGGLHNVSNYELRKSFGPSHGINVDGVSRPVMRWKDVLTKGLKKLNFEHRWTRSVKDKMSGQG